MTGTLPMFLVAMLLSGLLAGVVLWGLSRLFRPRPAPCPVQGLTSSFLIRNGWLADHDAGIDPDIGDWPQIREWLGDRFAGLPDELPAPGTTGTQRFSARQAGDDANLSITPVRGGHRVTLAEPHPPTPAQWHDTTRRLAREQAFCGVADAAPVAICTLSGDGRILWRNDLFGAFADSQADQIVTTAGNVAGDHVQVAIPDLVTGAERHFDLCTTGPADCRTVYATEITRQVDAEIMRGSFIQTLTKTFADLATGLAVFDREQRLVLFNPAMMDLTGLPADFLSARPGLLDFFDRLRERQVLPEPRHYAAWRAQINDMIETATGGHYAEAWTLPNGLTYRVTGRPHPDGAIAFLIEDITDEISLTRRSRTQIEIRQAVLDTLDEAVAVIGPDGLVMLCNGACRTLLGFDPVSSFAETGIDDLLRVCRARFPDPGFWDVIAAGQQRQSVRLHDSFGAVFAARCEPLPRGFFLLRLAPVTDPERITA